jgi:hypothetical protein
VINTTDKFIVRFFQVRTESGAIGNVRRADESSSNGTVFFSDFHHLEVLMTGMMKHALAA